MAYRRILESFPGLKRNRYWRAQTEINNQIIKFFFLEHVLRSENVIRIFRSDFEGKTSRTPQKVRLFLMGLKTFGLA